MLAIQHSSVVVTDSTRLEIGVELEDVKVAAVVCQLWRAVTADLERVGVFFHGPRGKGLRVLGILGDLRLGCGYGVLDILLGALIVFWSVAFTWRLDWPRGCCVMVMTETHINPLDLLAAELFGDADSLVLREDVVIHMNVFVDGAGVRKDPGHGKAERVGVRVRGGNVAVASDAGIRVLCGNHLVCPSRRESVTQSLEPEGHVDDGVGDLVELDVGDDLLFLSTS